MSVLEINFNPNKPGQGILPKRKSLAVFELESVSPSAQSRLKLTRRGLYVLTTLGALLLSLIIGVIFFFASANNAAAGFNAHLETAQYQVVTVKEGQSLWELAESFAPANMDLRDYILLVQELNDLNEAVVKPGQQITLPVN